MNLAGWYVACALATLAGAGAGAIAQDCKFEIRPPALDPAARDGHRDREIYGWQLMTHQERSEFLAQLDAARTPEERQSLRQRNHKAMDARARERGIVLSTPSKAGEDSRLHPAPARGHAATCVEAAK